MDGGEKAIERRLRRSLQRRGLALERSRLRDPSALGFGRYQVREGQQIIRGRGYLLTLNEVAAWLCEPDSASLETSIEVVIGDALTQLQLMAADSVDCCVTSPPFWFLRDYNHPRQLGLEASPDRYVARIVEVFREVRRVLRSTGTLWLNIGDQHVTRRAIRVDGRRSVSRDMANGTNSQPTWRQSSASGRTVTPASMNHLGMGLSEKNLMLLPQWVAAALRADGWCLRSSIIWAKTRSSPDPAIDRPPSVHEYVFLLTKKPSGYHYDPQPLESAGIWGDVWTLSPSSHRSGHSAMMPARLAELCIRVGCPPGGRVLDPFAGLGTTAVAAKAAGRSSTLIELNRAFAEAARRRV